MFTSADTPSFARGIYGGIPEMDLPKFGDSEAIRAAVEEQSGIIRAVAAEAEAKIAVERAKLKAIRAMCRHDYYTYSAMGDSGRRCKICGEEG